MQHKMTVKITIIGLSKPNIKMLIPEITLLFLFDAGSDLQATSISADVNAKIIITNLHVL